MANAVALWALGYMLLPGGKNNRDIREIFSTFIVFEVRGNQYSLYYGSSRPLVYQFPPSLYPPSLLPRRWRGSRCSTSCSRTASSA